MKTRNIYQVTSFQDTDTGLRATLSFDANHPVFDGHFPGNPIVPGVIQVQIIKELMEQKTGKKLLLVQGKNIKFLTIISPVRNPEIEVTLEISPTDEGQLTVQAVIRSMETTFMKFSGTYKLACD